MELRTRPPKRRSTATPSTRRAGMTYLTRDIGLSKYVSQDCKITGLEFINLDPIGQNFIQKMLLDYRRLEAVSALIGQARRHLP